MELVRGARHFDGENGRLPDNTRNRSSPHDFTPPFTIDRGRRDLPPPGRTFAARRNPSGRFHRGAGRERAGQRHGDGLFTRRPALCLPAGRSSSRYQQWGSAADSVCHGRHQLQPASVDSWESLSIRILPPTGLSMSTTRPQGRPTIASVVSPRASRTPTSRKPGARWLFLTWII